MKDLRTLLIISLIFYRFFTFSEVSNLRRSDIFRNKTHATLFIEFSKTDVYRQGHWVHLAKLSSELCPVSLLKQYFTKADISDTCQKYLFRGISHSKNGYRLRSVDKPISYATARENVITALTDIGLNSKDYGLHSLRAGGAAAAANLGINDRLFIIIYYLW